MAKINQFRIYARRWWNFKMAADDDSRRFKCKSRMVISRHSHCKKTMRSRILIDTARSLAETGRDLPVSDSRKIDIEISIGRNVLHNPPMKTTQPI